MAIGGRYTVRGFAESSISGDSGYYIKKFGLF
jgi:hemolysin activation/secretion protein